MRASAGASGAGPSAAETPIAHAAVANATHRFTVPIAPCPIDLSKMLRMLPDARHQLPDAPPPPELPPPPENPPPDDPDDELPPEVKTMPPTEAVPLVFMSSTASAYHGMRA